MNNTFKEYAAKADDKRLSARLRTLYSRSDDIRDAYARDYTRVLHSTAFRRLKHKTQVFYNISNDHICMRMEHVLHVESVAATISAELGLNVELARTIALAHDLGHAPFGHQGEAILNAISKERLGERFWHEANGLRTVDKLELLEDNQKVYRNLDLTYAVRDGIVSHCGEVNENNLRPRENPGELSEFADKNPPMPGTWEGCVVKISDKIAYLGRDIEDAISLGFLTNDAIEKLTEMARLRDESAINTTVIIHNMIIDICKNSSPQAGIALSPAYLEQLNELKAFNYKYIYGNARFKPYLAYSRLVIEQLFEHLMLYFEGEDTLKYIKSLLSKKKSAFLGNFYDWILRYCERGEIANYANEKLYGILNDEKMYTRAVIDYIAGMTDRYAIDCFNELITYA